MQRIWFLIFLWASTFAVHSQTTTDSIVLPAPVKKLTWGIRAGMNFAQVSGTGAQGFNKFGFSGGVFLEYRFAPKWSFKPEVTYSMKGSRRNPNPDVDDYYTFDISVDYLEVPLLFNFHFDRKDRFIFDFGPTVGFKVREVARENGAKLNYDRGFSTVELGICVGFDFRFHRSFGGIVRFYNSIVPIRAHASGQTVFQPLWGIVNFGQVNSLFQINLYYRFAGKKNTGNEAPKIKPKKPKKQRGDVIDED